MKKELKFEEALNVLEGGNAVICQLSSREDNTEVVRKKDRLEYLYNLSKEGIQLCKMYLVSDPKAKVPENAIEMSFDEAYEMVHAGNLVYYKEDGREGEITTVTELIGTRRRFERSGKKLVLYWYEWPLENT